METKRLAVVVQLLSPVISMRMEDLLGSVLVFNVDSHHITYLKGDFQHSSAVS